MTFENTTYKNGIDQEAIFKYFVEAVGNEDGANVHATWGSHTWPYSFLVVKISYTGRERVQSVPVGDRMTSAYLKEASPESNWVPTS